jgi:Cytidylate kinase
MKHRIITIGREFGSGGRTIGREVAAKLGIQCYDQELIAKMAEESGFTPDYVEKESENVTLNSWAASALSIDQGGFYAMPTNQDQLWLIQSRIICELAEKESCVIVGRCADTILEERADLLKVFIHADFEARAKRIVEKYGETEVPTEDRLREKDKRRAMYYQFYTDRKWGAIENYHVILDSGVLGLDKCVEIISSLY